MSIRSRSQLVSSRHCRQEQARPHNRARCSKRRGATAIEYAVMIALVLGGIVLGIEGLSLRTRHSLENTVGGLSGGPTELAATKTSHPEAAPRTASQPVPAIIATSAPFRYSGLLFASASMLIGTVGGLLTLRRKRTRPGRVATTAVPVEIDQEAIFAKRHAILRILSDDVGILLDSRMDVKHLMSRKLSTIGLRASADEVRKRMANEKIRHLLVCESSGELMGVISDRDLRNREASTAGDLMTADPLRIAPDSPVSPAITLLIQRRISCLPVVEDDRLVGVLTTTDLMMALQCALHALQKVAAEIADAHSQDNPEPTPKHAPTIAAPAPQLTV